MWDVRVLLLGGTSHVGKSTLAEALATRLGWRRRSTDAMARHPGRPWGSVPEHVEVHYRTMSIEELTTAQFEHYERLWPAVEQLVEAHAGDPTAERLVLEGSGILPTRVAARAFPHTTSYWLTADAATLRTRILTGSGFDHRTADERFLIEKFLRRTTRYDDLMTDHARQSGQRCIDVGGRSIDQLANQILAGCGGM